MEETEYELIRSSRKTLSMEIRADGRLIVRAPRRAPKRLIDEFVHSHEEWIVKHREKVMEGAAVHPEPDDELKAYCIKRAKEYIPPKAEYYARIMGVKYQAITITGAKTRFGSCSASDRLSFSWRVMLYPDECIDYVIVHELAHIRHKDHSKAFYDFIASVMPDHKKRRAGLRGSYRDDLPV